MHAAVNTRAPSAWIWFCSDRIAQDPIQRALTAVGIDCTLLRGDAASGPGLVFFDAVSPALCDVLRESSGGGLHRVLAVAVTVPVLEGGQSWPLLAAGASDVLAWDRCPDPAAAILARLTRWNAIDQLVRSPDVRDVLVGESRCWIAALRQIAEVARFTDASVLITGESGTGKELVARLIHALDARPAKGALVVLDCGTVVPTLSGSEFFGHERGAFTGAVTSRDGAFATASGGTLFLDEVGELPLQLQTELLRVIQEGMYKRVGSDTWRSTRFRLVCATNRDLLQEKASGRFRSDLYFRIAAWTCHLPSLRERVEDIPLLSRHFLREARSGAGELDLDPAVGDFLARRAYPGNVRDLKQLVARMAHRHEGPGPMTAGDVPPDERPSQTWDSGDWRDAAFEGCVRRALAYGAKLGDIARSATEIAVRIAVAEEGGNLRRAAVRLGVTDRALQMRRAASRERWATPRRPGEGTHNSM